MSRTADTVSMVHELQSSVQRRHGVPEVDVRWVANHLGRVRLVDVREPDELVGPLGRIEGVENAPLRGVTAAAAPWSRDQALVVLCRSGGRSGQAALALEKMGFTAVASMAGGMLEWHQHHLPVTS